MSVNGRGDWDGEVIVHQVGDWARRIGVRLFWAQK